MASHVTSKDSHTGFTHRLLVLMMSPMMLLAVWAGLRTRPSRGRSQRDSQKQWKMKNRRTKKKKAQSQQRVVRWRKETDLQTWYCQSI